MRMDPCTLSRHKTAVQGWDVDLEESGPSDATAAYSDVIIDAAEGPQV